MEELGEFFLKEHKSEVESLYKIYLWLSLNILYDLEMSEEQETQQVLANKLANSKGFANVFQKVAEILKIETRIVEGFAKDLDYSIGE